jgi:protein involved in polysaccharide export with SLBB domain
LQAGALLILLGIAVSPLAAQMPPADVDPRLLLALSAQDYPVTPGDIYLLSYSSGMAGGALSIPLTLDAGYQLKVHNMGVLNARGKTYMRLKTEVESLVSRNHPLSGPSFTLSRLGRFNVPVTGETLSPGIREVDGLTRVAAFLDDLTQKASIRFVRVTAPDGTVRTYDTFVGARTGNLDENPYVRPGDRIAIPAAARLVRIEGEILRPGTYELLPGEQLPELIEQYGGGLAREAAPEKLFMTRIAPQIGASRISIPIGWNGDRKIPLADGDIVIVPGKDSNRQAVFFEGAVFFISGDEPLSRDRDETNKAVARIPYYFYPGETLGRASRSIRRYFTEVSDLTKVYILRNGSRLPVDLERYIYFNDDSRDLALVSGDVIVVPYRQYYTITGEIAAAGDKPLNVLTRLSSLMTDLTAKASGRLVTVTSATGSETVYDLFRARRFGDLSQDPYIRPGDRIHVPAAGRRVTVAGEVFRPGEYELLPGEDLPVAVEYYAGGFTPEAAPDKITLSRLGTDATAPRELLYVSWSKGGAAVLADGDHISVANKDHNRQAVFFEGAVFFISNDENVSRDRDEAARMVARIPYYFYPGETVGRAGRSIRQYFTEGSDLPKAYILRNGSRLPVDLERPIYLNDDSGDIVLQSGDVIVIPYRQYYTITGEVAEAGDKTLNMLTRLSGLMTDLTARASTRLVTVTSPAGSTETYDLFQSRRFGDLSQDPYIRPGDRIHIPVAGCKVAVRGEVYRPGEYELLPGESLRELVEYYAEGFTLNANPGRIRLTRINTPEGFTGETQVFAYRENTGIVLADGDSIHIGNKSEERPIVFFEGAISAAVGSIEERSEEISGTSRMEYAFYPGETLGNAVRAIRSNLSAIADLTNAYIIRKEGQIPVDLRGFLYYTDFSKDITLENGDTVIIPFRQYFVLVSGAVKAPGRYPYVPDRTADYYVNLAGGRDELLNNGTGVRIHDMNNKSLPVGYMVPPESMINVPTNRITAHFNQYGPIITTILTLVSTTLSILAVTGVF